MPSTSSTTESIFDPTAASLLVLDPTPKIRQNSKGVSKNRRAHAVKRKYVKKSDLVSSNNDVGSLNSLDSEKRCLSIGEKVNEMEEKGKKEEAEGKRKCEGETIEVSESSDGVDEVLSRLEELQLGVEEPELSEQQLRINDQLQEDEVINSVNLRMPRNFSVLSFMGTYIYILLSLLCEFFEHVKALLECFHRL